MSVHIARSVADGIRTQSPESPRMREERRRRMRKRRMKEGGEGGEGGIMEWKEARKEKETRTDSAKTEVLSLNEKNLNDVGQQKGGGEERKEGGRKEGGGDAEEEEEVVVEKGKRREDSQGRRRKAYRIPRGAHGLRSNITIPVASKH